MNFVDRHGEAVEVPTRPRRRRGQGLRLHPSERTAILRHLYTYCSEELGLSSRDIAGLFGDIHWTNVAAGIRRHKADRVRRPRRPADAVA